MSELACEYCGTEVPDGSGHYYEGDRYCSECLDKVTDVTPVTDTVVWADDLWDRAIAALNDLTDFYFTHGHQPGAPAAIGAMADACRQGAQDIATLRQSWQAYMDHVSKTVAHRLTPDECAILTANLRARGWQ